MKKMIFLTMIMFLSVTVFAQLKVVTSYPYIKDIAERIGKDKIDVFALSKGNWDPHVIVPKPSYIARVRNADLLIINGAQLELGWIPPLLRQANNPNVMPAKRGFLDLSNYVQLIQVPDSVSRAQGDIHPAGNPHYCTDPYNIPLIARGITEKLCEILPENGSFFKENLNEFVGKWEKKIEEWGKEMAPLKGKKYIEYHRNTDYFLERYGLIVVGTVEPLPGIPPSSKHTIEIIEKVKSEQVVKLLHDVYHSPKCTQLISKKTGIPWVVLPQDVNAVKEANDIFLLFDQLVGRLLK